MSLISGTRFSLACTAFQQVAGNPMPFPRLICSQCLQGRKESGPYSDMQVPHHGSVPDCWHVLSPTINQNTLRQNWCSEHLQSCQCSHSFLLCSAHPKAKLKHLQNHKPQRKMTHPVHTHTAKGVVGGEALPPSTYSFSLFAGTLPQGWTLPPQGIITIGTATFLVRGASKSNDGFPPLIFFWWSSGTPMYARSGIPKKDPTWGASISKPLQQILSILDNRCITH